MSGAEHSGQAQARTLVDLLRHRAVSTPRRRAYLLLDDGAHEAGELDFGTLDLRARALAARLQRVVRAGERARAPLPARAGLRRGLLRVPLRARRGRARLSPRRQAFHPAPARHRTRCGRALRSGHERSPEAPRELVATLSRARFVHRDRLDLRSGRGRPGLARRRAEARGGWRFSSTRQARRDRPRASWSVTPT